MENKAEMALAQMRELLQKMGSSSQSSCYGDDETLLRFLRAKSMSPEKAAKMFAEWEKWRSEIAPSGNVDEAEITAELEARKAFLQHPTKDGHPLAILQACKHFAPKDQLQYKKFVAYLLDKAIASGARDEGSGSEKMVVIIDLRHLGLKNLDANGFLTAFQYLQSYYPERLEKLYILSMPWIFLGIWKLISAFLEKAILEKIVIVNNDAQKEEMIEGIGKEALPEDYGGIAKLTPIQDVRLSHWPTKN